MADTLATLGTGSSNANVAKIAIEQRKKRTDVVEPQVISEELLVDGVEEPVRPDGEAWDTIDFPQVTSLRLSFLNIIEIANLNNFDSLTTLRLDNNIIDKIANLSHLKQLTWLDLSFNNISEVDGLEELSNLQDLSLYHNQISEIKGLDGCKQLNVLSLGHNNISDLKQIDNLRKFKNLRCVCLAGNKVCQNDSYKQHVLAYLPHLKYLDYMLIDRSAVQSALEGYALDELTDVRDKEQAEEAKQTARQEKQKVIEKLKESFLECTEDLFEDLFGKDPEPEHVSVIPNYGALKDEYKDKLDDEVAGLRKAMEEKNEVRSKKVAAFEKAVGTAEKEGENEAFEVVREFRSMKKKVLAQLEQETREDVESVVQQLLEQMTGLEGHLMASELQLQESIEEATNEFEATVQEIIQVMSERGSQFFTEFADLEKKFYTDLVDAANTELDTFQQNQDSAIAEDDANKTRLLGSREEMHQAILTMTEAHQLTIQNLEDGMVGSMNNWKASFFGKHRESQYHRNRQRVTDIKQVIEECKEEILHAAETAAEFDEDREGLEPRWS